MAVDVWLNREEGTRLGPELEGFELQTRDRRGGKVAHVSFGKTFMVVQSGAVLRRSRRVVPAAAVEAVDTRGQLVSVGLTSDQIAQAPAYDARRGVDEKEEERIESYYSPLLT